MGEHSVQTLRADVRRHMKELASVGLGTLDSTKRRDVFILDPSHPGTRKLSPKAEEHENFIRSEDGSLLFRDAVPEFVRALDAGLSR